MLAQWDVFLHEVVVVTVRMCSVHYLALNPKESLFGMLHEWYSDQKVSLHPVQMLKAVKRLAKFHHKYKNK